MKRVLRLFVSICAGLIVAIPLFGAAALPAPASATPIHSGVQDFSFESYTADYLLSRDAGGYSTLKTVETFVAVFPSFDQNRGMIRAIPNDYDGVPLHTAVESVVDENGSAVPFTSSSQNGFTELALGTDDFVHGRTTYTITYTQQNVVRAFTDTNDDEFYWDTNGTGFSQPFGTVTARVHVDPSVTTYLTGNNACYRGAEGSNEQCEIVQSPDATSPDATNPDATSPAATGQLFTASAKGLGPGENLTVAIGFEFGTFVQVPRETTGPILLTGPAPWWMGAASIATLIAIVLGTAFTIVWRFVKPASSKGSGIIIPQYTPPKDLNLMESANIVGRAGSDVSAQIVSFAVRGKLRILDYPVTASGASYTLQLLDLNGLDAEELDLMKAIFSGVGERTLSILRESGAIGEGLMNLIESAFDAGAGEPADGMPKIGAVQEVGIVDDSAARSIAAVRKAVRDAVFARGLLQKRSPVVGILAAVLMFVLSFVSMGLFIGSAMYTRVDPVGIIGFILAIFGCFICLGFAFRPAVPTREGAERKDYLLGMRDYLQLAEADRFRMLQSPEGAERVRVEGIDIHQPAQKVKLYEKLLPFAVMWGIEREWAKEMAIYYAEAKPDWFVSAAGFDAARFSMSLSSIASTSVARPTPSSSSGWSGSGGGSFSGGSFGGGFSGGGGGGGGGGGR